MTMPIDDRARLRIRLSGLLFVAASLIALAIAWNWSPLRTWLDIDLMVASLQRLGQTFGIAAAVSGFALAVSLAVPLTFLTLVTLVALGPWVGFACSMAGAIIGAALSYGFGRYFGREGVQHLAGQRVNLLSQRLARHGLLAVIVMRLVPVAPFAVVNMVAGASHIRLRDMLLGTCIGMTPSTLLMAIFMHQIITALKQPNTTSALLLALTAVLVLVGVLGVRHWFRHADVTE